MGTQWENFLQNLGEWEGSFARLSPMGDFLESTPSKLSLEGLDDNQRVRLTLCYFPPAGFGEAPVKELVREYQSMGRDILYFENGAFSQGTIQLAPFSQFGAEFGFIAGDRRLRQVHLFDNDGLLEKLTLIRERRAGSPVVEAPPLTLNLLLGEWLGEACTLYPDWRSPDIYPTTLKLCDTGTGRLEVQQTFGSGADLRAIASTARIDGQILHFDQSSPPVRVVFLPDGASLTYPEKVQLRQPFFLEAGWLIQPDLRQRLIRRYSEKGEWVSLTLVTERKVISSSVD